MPDEPPLTRRILDATEATLRRHGAEKTNVVDVARSLGMSHANIYRHFPSKKALLEAVAARWLHQLMPPLEAIARDGTQPAPDRLAAWFTTLQAAKRRKVLGDPELFRVYHDIAMAATDLVNAHVADLLGMVERIIADGIARGEFAPGWTPPRAAAQACLHAMTAFHHPAMLMAAPPLGEEEARIVLNLLLAGLLTGPKTVGDKERALPPGGRPA